MPEDRPRKILFLLSSDHGELFNALYFLLGSGLGGVAVMPPKMLATNANDFPYPAYEYRSAEDFLRIVDLEQPDLVLLFSGYLYVINRLLDLASFETLLAGLRARGVPVATTDPSVGVMSKVDGAALDPSNPGRDWLLDLSPRLFGMLRDLPHLYLAPEVETVVSYRSFFNPRIVPDAEGMASIREAVHGWDPVTPELRRWFYVLSPEDYAVQLGIMGAASFTNALVGRLKDVVGVGRQPILIAPRNCITRLRATGEHFGSLVALQSCNYTMFMRLLLEAEQVFYWNTFSASIVARALARRPVHFFDRGHLAGTLRPFFEVGMRHFYRDCVLPQLDFGAPLDAEELAARSLGQEESFFDPIWSNLSRSPWPEQVVEELL